MFCYFNSSHSNLVDIINDTTATGNQQDLDSHTCSVHVQPFTAILIKVTITRQLGHPRSAANRFRS